MAEKLKMKTSKIVEEQKMKNLKIDSGSRQENHNASGQDFFTTI